MAGWQSIQAKPAHRLVFEVTGIGPGASGTEGSTVADRCLIGPIDAQRGFAQTDRTGNNAADCRGEPFGRRLRCLFLPLIVHY